MFDGWKFQPLEGLKHTEFEGSIPYRLISEIRKAHPIEISMIRVKGGWVEEGFGY